MPTSSVSINRPLKPVALKSSESMNGSSLIDSFAMATKASGGRKSRRSFGNPTAVSHMLLGRDLAEEALLAVLQGDHALFVHAESKLLSYLDSNPGACSAFVHWWLSSVFQGEAIDILISSSFRRRELGKAFRLTLSAIAERARHEGPLRKSIEAGHGMKERTVVKAVSQDRPAGGESTGQAS